MKRILIDLGEDEPYLTEKDIGFIIEDVKKVLVKWISSEEFDIRKEEE